MIAAKFHQSGKELLLAACDCDLIGRIINLSNGAEVKILESFYKDRIVSEEELIKMANECTTANFFGKETVNALVKGGIIGENSAILLSGVPHSQLYKFF
jgi:hypothetical protein